jgi:acetyl-CoA synthetase
MADPDDVFASWERIAGTLSWRRPWDELRSGSRPGTWFAGGRLNLAENCLDRHLPARADAVALHWEGEPGDRLSLTYGDLHSRTVAFTRALQGLGVVAGDRVALHLGAVPELPVAVLACARLGAVCTALSGALPVEALAERLRRFRARVLVTQDGAWRHGTVLPLKARADEALAATGTVEAVVVVRRTGIDVNWYESDQWFTEINAAGGSEEPPPPDFASDHPLVVFYSPRPQGLRAIVHGSAGVLAMTTAVHQALSPDPDDVLWCAWEAAWVAGMTHGLIGPLAGGGTAVLYEGMLDTPNRNRTWEIVERYRITGVATTPTVVERLRQWSSGPGALEQIGSLRRIITAAEALSPPDRDWLDQLATSVGATVHDGWGQGELGGVVALTPRLPTSPPDVGFDVVDPSGKPVAASEAGELVLRRPWAGIFVAVEDEDEDDGDDGDDGYWSDADDPELFHTRDRARRESDGAITILGRIDPVVKVSGQLVSTEAITDLLCQHPLVRDAEVLQVPGPDGGRLLVAWVVPGTGPIHDDDLASDLRGDLHEMLGGLSVPPVMAFVEEFPPELSREERRQALRAFGARQSIRVFNVGADDLRRLARGS